MSSSSVPEGPGSAVTASLPTEGRLPGFDGATGWLNSPGLTGTELQGKVVLVDFWTFTCINWLRTLGYVRAWAEKYADHGLVVIGVHTPEFPFERDIDNVRRAVKDMNVEYPVPLDSDYAIWHAFANRYWPAVYVADAEGRIRHHQFGEGGYEECERVVQALLREQALNFVDGPFDRLRLNQWALSGDWSIEAGASVLNGPDGRIGFRFHARDVHLVLRSRAGNVPFQVRVDGEPPGEAHGLDVDEDGRGTLAEPRLYQLIRQRGPIADRLLEVGFSAPGVEAYAFTFG
jgi:thiol-disulfide isomerase/thioredoxin